jgi:hypothetical protein
MCCGLALSGVGLAIAMRRSPDPAVYRSTRHVLPVSLEARAQISPSSLRLPCPAGSSLRKLPTANSHRRRAVGAGPCVPFDKPGEMDARCDALVASLVKIPPHDVGGARTQLGAFGDGTRVSVRSSATTEDLRRRLRRSADTYLNRADTRILQRTSCDAGFRCGRPGHRVSPPGGV